MIVDVRKLDQQRDLLDEVVAEESIDSGSNRADAYLKVGQRLGYNIQVERSGIWWFASAISDDENRRTLRIYFRHGASAAMAYESRVRLLRESLALAFEDALSALVCLLIDPSTDIELKSQSAPHETNQGPDTQHFWHEWAFWIWDGIDEHIGRDEFREMTSPRAI